VGQGTNPEERRNMSTDTQKNKSVEQSKPKPRRPEDETNDETYDKTIEDSFPASDPPSSIPDPEDEENAA
jgi:hypothetical protein